jgi:hypothetical protein
MKRSLLAISLCLFAGMAFAGESATAFDAQPECPRTAAKARAGTPVADPVVAPAPTQTAPGIRSRGAGAAASTRLQSPRWHSLLPGMFR